MIVLVEIILPTVLQLIPFFSSKNLRKKDCRN